MAAALSWGRGRICLAPRQSSSVSLDTLLPNFDRFGNVA